MQGGERMREFARVQVGSRFNPELLEIDGVNNQLSFEARFECSDNADNEAPDNTTSECVAQ